MTEPQRPLPEPDALTRFFWEHARRHELAILRCQRCASFVHPPRPLCRGCLSADLAPQMLRGRARVYAHTWTHHVFHPAFAGDVPYAIALVEIEEDPSVRLVTRLVDCAPDEVRAGLEVEVLFEDVDDQISLPLFRPRRGG